MTLSILIRKITHKNPVNLLCLKSLSQLKLLSGYFTFCVVMLEWQFYTTLGIFNRKTAHVNLSNHLHGLKRTDAMGARYVQEYRLHIVSQKLVKVVQFIYIRIMFFIIMVKIVQSSKIPSLKVKILHVTYIIRESERQRERILDIYKSGYKNESKNN